MTPQALKLVSVNIEGHKHLNRVLPFLQSSGADVVCLQEVFRQDFYAIQKTLGMNGTFAPMTIVPLRITTGPLRQLGIALLSRLPMRRINRAYYHGDAEHIPLHKMHDVRTIFNVLTYAQIINGDVSFTIGTTHFTWTPDGQADDYQRRDLNALFGILHGIPEIALCGDFNAPRGREIFSAIAARYKDRIPPEYSTSIDGTVHRDGPLQVMVDGLFTTLHYRAENVALISGVSDHCAIVAEISRI